MLHTHAHLARTPETVIGIAIYLVLSEKSLGAVTHIVREGDERIPLYAWRNWVSFARLSLGRFS